MRHCLFLLFLFQISSCVTSRESTNTTVPEQIIIKGKLTYIDRYCGGAPPSEEILERLKSPKPLAGYLLIVKEGRENNVSNPKIKEIETDEEGQFQIELPQGDYLILSEAHLDNKILTTPGRFINISDHKSLSEWWKSGLAMVNSDTTINQQFKKRCHLPLGIPGLRYSGPIAP